LQVVSSVFLQLVDFLVALAELFFESVGLLDVK
jgi:hypothetical protein